MTTPAATSDPPAETPAKSRSGGLSGKLLPELKAMAGGLGIKGAGGMRKSQLVDAIKAAQSGHSAPPGRTQSDQGQPRAQGHQQGDAHGDPGSSGNSADARSRNDGQGRQDRSADGSAGNDNSGGEHGDTGDSGDSGDNERGSGS
ncbi:MAG: Rho termination factor N-terminal domain-containing protein, partial [Nocardioidaceae bacterium]